MGLNVSNYINMFINSDEITLKTTINNLANDNKLTFINVATKVLNDIADKYERSGSQDLNAKAEYERLMQKFKEAFPDQWDAITTINNIAQKKVYKSKVSIIDHKAEFNALLGKVNEQLKAPSLPTDKIQENVDALLKFVNTHPDVFTEDPTLATKGHQCLHDVAQKEIAAGNYQSAFTIESNAVQAFPVNLPSHHPLLDIAGKQVDPKMGVHFGSMDSSVVKGGHLHATQRTIDGHLTNSIDFKISHYARDELTKHVEVITQHLNEFKSSLPSGLCSDVEINSYVPQIYKRYDEAADQFTKVGGYRPFDELALVIEFKAAGKIIIGSTPETGCMYNWIQVEMDASLLPGEGVKKLQQILAMTGLGPVLGQQPRESDERMKFAQLLRAFYPARCTELDVSKEFYELPLEELKKKIMANHIEAVSQEYSLLCEEKGIPIHEVELKQKLFNIKSEMEAVFQKYLVDNQSLMQKVEIQQGKEVWGVMDFDALMKSQGAWGLMTGIGNTGSDTWLSAKNAIVRALTQGAMSSEQRFQAGIFVEGASSSDDLRSGGGDQVFTRLVNNRTGEFNIDDFAYHGEAQILWDLAVVQRIPYGYDNDTYGIRNRFDDGYINYKNRPNPQTLAEKTSNPTNEVMLKNSVAPRFVKGIMVPNQERKDDLIEYLKINKLAEETNGEIWITCGDQKVKANQFIHIGDEFKQDYWK